ncbi:hypothetical protein PK1910_00950 [Veillonella parvula]|uniref:hypothetical protein n=1 Tax=Veillonella parvula TaxID=29466 RepID=UPI002F3593B9
MMTQQLKAKHRKPMRAKRLGRNDEPTSLQMALFTFLTLGFFFATAYWWCTGEALIKW